jgi:hypothetical protein
VTKLCECGCGQPAPVATRNRYDRGQRKGEPLRFVSGHNIVPIAHVVRGSAARRGASSPHWLGDNVSYYGIHVWLAKHHPKTGICAECGAEAGKTCSRTEWAFLRHPERHTRDISDYRELCRRCHYRLDH